MTVFIDTSALYALLDSAEPRHNSARETLLSLRGTALFTHNYVVVETVALVQRRLGVAAVADLADSLLRPVEIVWVDSELHRAGVEAVLAWRQRDVSLVDHISFLLMRRRRLSTAFAFDSDFVAAGFGVVPGE